ncbi:hypothetical protein Tco_0666275 [Tanacetum coccineum]
MGDEKPIHTLGDYSKPSHEGYRNTIELPVGNNVDPNQHLKAFLKLVDSLDLDGENRERTRLRPSPQPQALETTFEARVRDYMAAHTERMERFENTIFKQRGEINSRMTEMFGLLKELTTNKTPEKSIDQGPFELGTTRNTLGTTPEGGVLLGPVRPRTYDDLSDTKKKRYDADVRATNVVLQGLPKDIYKLINHNIEAKEIWDNVKMLLAGSELTKEDRESQLYDEFERFKMLPAVKLNKCLKETNHEQLYAYLKQYEKHAAQDRLVIGRITPTTNDQLAFVSTVQPHAPTSHVQSHQYPSSSTTSESPQYPHFPKTSQIDSGHTQTDEILDNLTKQMALLAQSFRATLPQTNNQL